MNLRALTSVRRSAAFTMVEIAICLAIIGLALVAIIGVLPLGMKVQRDNREETVINQDATVLLESIRNGVRGGYDLTNYVTEIDNYVTLFDQNLAKIRTDTYIYTLTNYTVNGSLAAIQFGLTNNARIVGLLSTPEFLDGNYNPVNLLVPNGISNHVEMNLRAMKMVEAGGTLVLGARAGVYDRRCHVVELALPGLLAGLEGAMTRFQREMGETVDNPKLTR